jgi:hypothetical protein
MANGIIERNITGHNGTIVDIVADAADIIALGGQVGSTYTFILKNTSTDFTSIIQINSITSMGTNVTLKTNTQNIFPGYQYTAQIKIVSLTEVELITLNNNISLINQYFNYRFEKSILNLGFLQCHDYMLETALPGFPLTIGEFYPGEYSISVSPSEGLNNCVLTSQVITGNLPNDPVDNNRVTISDSYPANFVGSFEFYLANPSASAFPLVFDFTKLDFSIRYTQDPYSIYSIPPGSTGWFLVTWDYNLFPGLAGHVYTLGIFDTI